MGIRGESKKHQHKNTRDFSIDPPTLSPWGGGCDLDVLVVNQKNLGGRSLFCLSLTKKNLRFGDLELILRLQVLLTIIPLTASEVERIFHHLNIYAAHTLQESKSLIQEDQNHHSQFRLVGG